MRNTCAQSGWCSKCSAEIFRMTPVQAWMAVETLANVCTDGQPHKLSPFTPLFTQEENNGS